VGLSWRSYNESASIHSGQTIPEPSGEHGFMSTDATSRQADAPQRHLNCKGYHVEKKSMPGGRVRSGSQKKSRCPLWARDATVRQQLLDEALVDTHGNKDMWGNPMTLWNAINGEVFVGVSCNLQIATYNCYPTNPPDGKLYAEIRRRKSRKLPAVVPRGRNRR
jgi:hypothetical protein